MYTSICVCTYSCTFYRYRCTHTGTCYLLTTLCSVDINGYLYPYPNLQLHSVPGLSSMIGHNF